MTRTALYRHFDADGQLLYVGVTNDPKRRLAEHKCRAPWADQIDRVCVDWLSSRQDGLIAEANAIEAERPLFNNQTREHEPTGDALRDWMAVSGETQKSLADYLGISRSSFAGFMASGRRVPLVVAVRIEDLSEGAVPVRYWLGGAA